MRRKNGLKKDIEMTIELVLIMNAGLYQPFKFIDQPVLDPSGELFNGWWFLMDEWMWKREVTGSEGISHKLSGWSELELVQR